MVCVSVLEYNPRTLMSKWSVISTDTKPHNNLLIAPTILPANSDSNDMFCLQSYQELVIDKSLVY